MSLEERAKATAKNLEGKLQDAIGNLTGDPQDQIQGKAKQVEAAAIHTKENLKDDLKREIDRQA